MDPFIFVILMFGGLVTMACACTVEARDGEGDLALFLMVLLGAACVTGALAGALL